MWWAIPPRRGSRTYPGPRRSSPSRTPFLHATGILLPTPGHPTGYLPESWTGSSGACCRPGSCGRRPSGFRRAYACWLDAPSERWTGGCGDPGIPRAAVTSRQGSSGNSSLRSVMVRRCLPTSLASRGHPRPWYAVLVRAGFGGHTAKPAGPSWTYRVPMAVSPSRKDDDIAGRRHPEGVVPGQRSQPANSPVPRPVAASPTLIGSSTGSPAYPPQPLPPHTGLWPESNSLADTPVCPPWPVPTGWHRPGTSRRGSWPPRPVFSSTDRPHPRTSCRAWGSRPSPAHSRLL